MCCRKSMQRLLASDALRAAPEPPPYVCDGSSRLDSSISSSPLRIPPVRSCRLRRHFSPQMRFNRFVFLNLPMLSLETHLGVTTSPHAPFPAGYVTRSMSDRSPPLRFSSAHHSGWAFRLLPPSLSSCIAYADVGGGYPRHELALVSLDWMILRLSPIQTEAGCTLFPRLWTSTSIVVTGTAFNTTRALASRFIEIGNGVKGLVRGTGAGTGPWRLSLVGDIEFEAHAYVAAPDGLLTAVASPAAWAHRVAVLEPQRGVLRLANPGAQDASVLVSGTDAAGASQSVVISVPALSAVELMAASLESGEAEAIVSRGAGRRCRALASGGGLGPGGVGAEPTRRIRRALGGALRRRAEQAGRRERRRTRQGFGAENAM